MLKLKKKLKKYRIYTTKNTTVLYVIISEIWILNSNSPRPGKSTVHGTAFALNAFTYIINCICELKNIGIVITNIFNLFKKINKQYKAT